MKNKEKYSDYIKEFLESISTLTEDDFDDIQTHKTTSDINKIMEEPIFKIDLEDNFLEDSENSSDYEDLFINPIEKLNKKNKYPISEYQAFQIANENQNLKSDYCRNTYEKITYLNFTNCTIKLLTKNKKKYWHIKITGGKKSWIDFNEENNKKFTETIFYDGFLIEEDFKKLQCLIDVNTGEYTYYDKRG